MQDSQEWGLSGRQALALMAIPVVIVLAMTAAVPFFEFFVWVTAEDSVIEWLQFLMLLAAGLLFTRLGAALIRGGQVYGAIPLLAALGLFFIAGEEIAWGQRLLGLETPETLQDINVQNELTLHNISWAHQVFIYTMMLCGVYGTIVPLDRLAQMGDRPRSALSYLLVPPACLVTAFLMPFGYRFTRLALPLEAWFPHLVFPITKFSEVTELCLYFGVLVFAWLNVQRLGQGQPALAGSTQQSLRSG